MYLVGGSCSSYHRVSFKFNLLSIWMAYSVLHQLNSGKPIVINVISSSTYSSNWFYLGSVDSDFWTCHMHRKCKNAQIPVTWVLTFLQIFWGSQQHALHSSFLCGAEPLLCDFAFSSVQIPEESYHNSIKYKPGFDLAVLECLCIQSWNYSNCS